MSVARRLVCSEKSALEDEDEDEGAELNVCVYYLVGTLVDDVKGLRTLARQLAEETDPKWWAKYPAEWLARRERNRHGADLEARTA